MSLQQPSGIVTPEAVLLEFDTAGVGSRTAAELLDVLIQVTVLGLLSLAAVFLAGAVGGGAGTVALIIMLIMALVVIVGYPLAMESLWGGRTLGKAALGLRVVTVEGGPVRVRQSATRAIIGVFELWATFGSVAVLTTILTRDNQRLGDLLAGTLVLRERAAMSTTATAMSFPAPYGYADYVASIDVSVLTSDQYGVIRTFLMRVLDLTTEARGALAVNLANSTAVTLHHTPPSNVPPELFLVCVASAYQARHGGVVPPATGWGAQPAPPPGVAAGPYPGYGPQPSYAPQPGYAPQPAYGQQPGYAPQPGYGQQPGYAPPPPPAQQPVYAPPPTSPPYPGPPVAPPAAPPPHPQWAPPPVPSAPPRFDTPPAAAPPAGPVPGSPPRFDQPPVDPQPTATVPVEPTATIGAEPAPWPPRKPGRPPASAPGSSSTRSSDPEPSTVDPQPTVDLQPAADAPAETSATIGAEPAPWPPRKPGPHPSTLAAGGAEADGSDGDAPPPDRAR